MLVETHHMRLQPYRASFRFRAKWQTHVMRLYKIIIKLKRSFRIVFVLASVLLGFNLHAQQTNHLRYVDPFIGTTVSNVLTKWGNNGGCYPGAVAPSGSVQLSPETRVAGGCSIEWTTGARLAAQVAEPQVLIEGLA